MSWMLRDFECECGEIWEDLIDSRDDQVCECPKCQTVCKFVLLTAPPLKAFSLRDKDGQRQEMLRRSAEHTLSEIKKEPEKHGDIGKKIYRENTISSSKGR